MTYREYMRMVHPSKLEGWAGGGVMGCPADYILGPEHSGTATCPSDCDQCWNREIKDTSSDTWQEKFKPHIGHRIECNSYGDPVRDVTIECVDCNEILFSSETEDRKCETENEGEEKIMPTTVVKEKRTKAELLEEIKDLKAEVERLDRYKKYEETASEMKAMHDAFVNEGFTSDQAFALVQQMISAAGAMCKK